MMLAVTLFACGDSASDGRALEAEAGAQAVGASVGAVDARVQDVEGVGSTGESTLTAKEQWAEGKAEWLSLSEGAALEGTVRLAEDSGGDVHFVDHPGRGDRSVLVTPLAFVDGADPAHRVPSRLRRKRRLPERLRAASGARERRRVRAAAALRDARRRGEPLLEPHRPVLRGQQERRG